MPRSPHHYPKHPTLAIQITNIGFVIEFVQGRASVQVTNLRDVQGKTAVRGQCSGQIEGQNQLV